MIPSKPLPKSTSVEPWLSWILAWVIYLFHMYVLQVSSTFSFTYVFHLLYYFWSTHLQLFFSFGDAIRCNEPTFSSFMALHYVSSRRHRLHNFLRRSQKSYIRNAHVENHVWGFSSFSCHVIAIIDLPSNANFSRRGSCSLYEVYDFSY